MDAASRRATQPGGTDRDRLALRRERARRRAARPGAPDPAFLLDLVVEELIARVTAVSRPFAAALDLLTPTPALAEALAAARPGLAIERRLDAQVTRLPGGSEDLGLEAGAYDLVVSAFGLHWIDDLPGALVQVRRALKPDGLFMAALPGEGSFAELRRALLAAEAEVSGGAGLRMDRVVPVREAGALLQRAGLALPVADLEHHALRYASLAGLIGDLRGMAATAMRAGRPTPMPRALPARIEAHYRAADADADGRLRASVSVLMLTGWAPHESQQKPLAPGSGQVSLASVLGRPR